MKGEYMSRKIFVVEYQNENRDCTTGDFGEKTGRYNRAVKISLHADKKSAQDFIDTCRDAEFCTIEKICSLLAAYPASTIRAALREISEPTYDIATEISFYEYKNK